MATDNDITQDETLDEDLVTQPADGVAPPPPEPQGVDGEATPPPPPPPEPQGVDDAATPPPASQDTDGAATPPPPPAPQARYLSEREAAELRKIYGDPKMKRLVRRLVAFGLVALVFGLGFLFQWLRTEQECTWPGELAGQFDDGEEPITLDGETIADVFFPHAPGWTVNRIDDGNLEIYSCVGKFCNVPLRVAFSARKLENGWRRTLEQSFSDYCTERKAAGEVFNSAGAKKFYLREDTGYGFPAMSVEGLKSARGRNWGNRIIYFRYRDWECVLERGCLANEYRAAKLLKEVNCLVIYRKAAGAHFAIPEQRMPGEPLQLFRRARAAMARNLDVSDWREIDGALRTVLTIAYETGNKDMIGEGAGAWADWRRLQEQWFAGKRFAYGEACRREDKETCNQLRRLCLSQVEGTDDARCGHSIGAEWEEE